MPLYRLVEKEAGDVLFDKDFTVLDDMAAERFQADRWNQNYCMGEPRVLSQLYRTVDGSGS
jgi:hypothetical protein